MHLQRQTLYNVWKFTKSVFQGIFEYISINTNGLHVLIIAFEKNVHTIKIMKIKGLAHISPVQHDNIKYSSQEFTTNRCFP